MGSPKSSKTQAKEKPFVEKVAASRSSSKGGAKTKRRELVKKVVRTVLTWKDLLRQKLEFLHSDSQKFDKNSRPIGRPIDLLDVRLWDPFIAVEEVEALWETDPEFKKAMEEELGIQDRIRAGSEDQDFGAVIDEIDFEVIWRSTVHRLINLFNREFRKFLPGRTPTNEKHYIKMGGGTSARLISPNAEPATGSRKGKKPDHSGFLYLGDRLQFRPEHAEKVYNRIPGDAKLHRKIRRSWLPPDGEVYLRRQKKAEAQSVLTQIHGYMDMHEARYGYIVTDKELIFLRCRPGKRGQLDISQAIRHDVEPDRDSGRLNSLYVLFYFHWKVANDDGPDGWKLESYGKA